jgi:hypothetical protein
VLTSVDDDDDDGHNNVNTVLWRLKHRQWQPRCTVIITLFYVTYFGFEKISWTDHVRNEEVLLRVSEQRNILHEIRKQKPNWIRHILRRNCLLKEDIGGKIKGQIEVTRRWGRRRKKLLDDLGDGRGYSHLKEEALDHIKWWNRFRRGCGPVIWQITDDVGCGFIVRWQDMSLFLLVKWHLFVCILLPTLFLSLSLETKTPRARSSRPIWPIPVRVMCL